jgi:type II secretory pathway component PulF
MDRAKAVQIANLIYKLEDIECFEEELQQFLESTESSPEDLDVELLKVVAKYKEKLEAQLEEM